MATDTRSASVMEYLQADHRRLDGIMGSCKQMAEGGNIEGARAAFSEFQQGLLRHIRIEEEMLFPEFEAATGLPKEGGPTGVMRYEHVEIQRLLGLILDVFQGAQPSVAEFERLRSALVALLHEHNMKEERILYPMTDQMVAPARRLEMCRQMKEYK